MLLFLLVVPLFSAFVHLFRFVISFSIVIIVCRVSMVVVVVGRVHYVHLEKKMNNDNDTSIERTQ